MAEGVPGRAELLAKLALRPRRLWAYSVLRTTGNIDTILESAFHQGAGSESMEEKLQQRKVVYLFYTLNK